MLEALGFGVVRPRPGTWQLASIASDIIDGGTRHISRRVMYYYFLRFTVGKAVGGVKRVFEELRIRSLLRAAGPQTRTMSHVRILLSLFVTALAEAGSASECQRRRDRGF